MELELKTEEKTYLDPIFLKTGSDPQKTLIKVLFWLFLSDKLLYEMGQGFSDEQYSNATRAAVP